MEQEFRSFFTSRTNFSLQNDTAYYFNDDTEVSFSFRQKTEESGLDWEPGFSTEFLMGTPRSMIFAREAGLEIGKFVSSFDLSVSSPDGSLDASFNQAGFLKSWSETNLFNVRAAGFRDKNFFQFQSLPSVELERYWFWNMYSSQLLKMKDCIGKVRLCRTQKDGTVKSFVKWNTNQEMFVTPVDLVLVGENCIPWEVLAELMIPQCLDGIDYFLLRTNGKIQGTLIEHSTVGIEAFVSFDRVLDSEVVMDAYKQNSKSQKSCLAPPLRWE